jgi:hypothetical protein
MTDDKIAVRELLEKGSDATFLRERSCPDAWCRSDAPGRVGPPRQAAMAGRLTVGLWLMTPSVSRLM